MFALIHRRDELDETAFQAALLAHQKNIMDLATNEVPDKCHVLPLAKRFREHGEAYFRFITTPGVVRTNNIAEQAIRFVVIDRRIKHGTRSEAGRHWCERIWPVIATCASQGRSVFDFILEAFTLISRNNPPPLF